MILTYVIIAIYILALIYIGIRDHETEDKDGFIIADRKVGILGTLSSMSASFRDGTGLVLWVSMGFAAGYALYNIFLGLIIGFFLLALMAPRARKLAKKHNYITIGQMVKTVVGYRTEKVSSFIVLLASALVVSIQFYVLGDIVSMLLGIDVFNSILLTAVIVAFYVSSGGYKSIVKTDILQFFIMLSLWGVLFFLPLKSSYVLDFSSVYKGSNPIDFIFPVLYAFTLCFCLADFWQRMFSAKSDKTAKLGLRLAPFGLILLTLPLTFIGMSAHGIIANGLEGKDVVMAILNNDQYPRFLISFFTLVGISITMSTLDTYAYVFSSSILENFMKVSISYNKKKYIYVSKIIMITMLLVAAVLALTIENVIQHAFNAYSLIMVLSPLFIATGAGWFKHKSDKLDLYITISLITAFLIGAYLFIQGYMTSFALMMIPAGLSSVFILISYIYAKLKHEVK